MAHIITIGELQSAPGWMWLVCADLKCGHNRPVAIAPYVIRWGAETPVDWLRRSPCSKCGNRRALTIRPSWADMTRGWQSFPVTRWADGSATGHNPKCRPLYIKANAAGAETFATDVLPIIHQIQAVGAKTPRVVAAALNARGIRTARDGA